MLFGQRPLEYRCNRVITCLHWLELFKEFRSWFRHKNAAFLFFGKFKWLASWFWTVVMLYIFLFDFDIIILGKTSENFTLNMMRRIDYTDTFLHLRYFWKSVVHLLLKFSNLIHCVFCYWLSVEQYLLKLDIQKHTIALVLPNMLFKSLSKNLIITNKKFYLSFHLANLLFEIVNSLIGVFRDHVKNIFACFKVQNVFIMRILICCRVLQKSAIWLNWG